MQNNITWRNHYIPQFILKDFLNDKINKIYCINVFEKNAKWMERNTKSCGFKEHLYTYNHDDNIEKQISKIEDDFSQIVKKIKKEKMINNFSSNEYFNYYHEIKNYDDIFTLYIAIQYLRNPLFYQRCSDFRQFYNNKENIINEKPILKTIYYNEDLIPSIFNLLPKIKKIIEDKYRFYSYFSYKSDIILPDSGIAETFFLEKYNNMLILPISNNIIILAIRKEMDFAFSECFLNKNKSKQFNDILFFQDILYNNIHSQIFCKNKIDDKTLNKISKRKFLNAFTLGNKAFLPNTEYTKGAKYEKHKKIKKRNI